MLFLRGNAVFLIHRGHESYIGIMYIPPKPTTAVLYSPPLTNHPSSALKELESEGSPPKISRSILGAMELLLVLLVFSSHIGAWARASHRHPSGGPPPGGSRPGAGRPVVLA